jgi:GNAT superfamily N-acetyltransferase
MQRHDSSIDIGAPVADVWNVFWNRDRPRAEPPRRRLLPWRARRFHAVIHILHPGDSVGDGLVRHCWFPVPWWLGSGGVGESWEWLTEVVLHESWRYDAIGKPLWSRAEGHTRLEDLGDGRTRVHFSETYHACNPVMRALFERRVHAAISRDNDEMIALIERAIR